MQKTFRAKIIIIATQKYVCVCVFVFMFFVIHFKLSIYFVHFSFRFSSFLYVCVCVIVSLHNWHIIKIVNHMFQFITTIRILFVIVIFRQFVSIQFSILIFFLHFIRSKGKYVFVCAAFVCCVFFCLFAKFWRKELGFFFI